MATVNFTKATETINSNAADLVRFDTVGSATGASWSWKTPDGADLTIEGSGMTFDAGGHATGGTVNRIGIDEGNNNFFVPDIEITGLNVSAAVLDDSPEVFWRTVLAGNDTISGPSAALAGTAGVSQIFGDGISAAAGPSQGGDDFIDLGTAGVDAVGDMTVVGNNNIAAPLAILTGGDDQLFLAASGLFQSISGDASFVLANGALFGGDDFLQIANVDTDSRAVGDAVVVQGAAAHVGFLEGGDDGIVALGESVAQLIGDARQMNSHATVIGGNDGISGSEQGEVISGDVGFITSTTGQSFVGGNDTLNGNGGFDIISGDVGDAVFGARITGGDDIIHGGEGDDRILGEVNELDLSQVKGGDDLLFGDAGSDLLFGQTGNDQLDGGTGADSLDGGSGFDFAAYGSAKAGLTADLLSTTLNTGDAKGDSYAAIEGLSGSDFADTLRGDNAVNEMAGGGGIDILSGRGGADSLFGEDGNDRLDGGAGADLMNGGQGADAYTVDASGDLVFELANQGVDSVVSSVSHTLAANVENLTLAGGSNLAGTGNALANVIQGNAGVNTMSGGAGGDRLFGADGADRLRGDAGADVLTGGDGADRFIFATLGDSTAAAGSDTIADFSRGEGDRIDLALIDADIDGTAGNQAFSFIGGAAFSGVDGQLRTFTSGANTFVAGDVNGDKVADFQFRVVTDAPLTACDFLL